MFDIDPLSRVAPHPISQFSSIKTIPIWGYLKFLSLIGKKPKPCFPITQLSNILTLFFINVFLIMVLDPTEQLSEIITFFSIIVLCPILQFLPIEIFSPIKTFLPKITLSLNLVSFIGITVSSKSSFIEFG